MLLTRGSWLADWVWLGIVGGGLTTSAHVLAEGGGPERSFSLAYRAPSTCPDASSLRAAIETRSVGATAVSAESAVVHFTVELRESGQSVLWVDLPEGSFRREFQAGSCVEAVATLAVITSMVLDAAPDARRAMATFAPESDTTQTAKQPEVAPPPAVSPSEPAAAADAPKAPPATPPADRPKPPPPPRRAAPARETSRADGHVRWALTAGAATETAVASTPPVGGTAGVEAWLSRASWWSPSVRATLLATTTATETAADGDAKFRLLAGRLQACPFRRPLAAWFRVAPCAVFEAGSLHAQGAGSVQNIRTTTMPWWAGGLSLLAELELGKQVALEGGADGKLLARRDHFVFGPDNRRVYDVPAFSFGLEAGVLLRLP